MSFVQRILACLIAVPILAASAAAQVLTPADQMVLGSPFPGDPSAGADPVTITLSNPPSGGYVAVTLAATGISGSEFASAVYLNLNPVLNFSDLSFSIASGNTTALTTADISVGENAFKSDGDGYYDLLFSFPTSPPSSHFTSGEQVQVDISSSQRSLSASDLLYLSTEGGGEGDYYAAAHVQGLSGGVSTWVGAASYSSIPELPSAACILGGLALVGACAIGLRRQQLAAVA